MTVSVKVHVNGKYKATVTHTASPGATPRVTEVHGNYEGSPNPSGELVVSPGTGTFEISEKQVVDDKAVGASIVAGVATTD